MDIYTKTYSSKEKALLLPWLVDELARRHNVSNSDEFRNLYACDALTFYDRCFGVLHTYSIEDAADSLEEFCNNHKNQSA